MGKKIEFSEVKEVQVGGVRTCYSLKAACIAYLELLSEACPDKIHFYIGFPGGGTSCISFRQEGEKIYVYGDFEGLKDCIEFAKFIESRGLNEI